MELQEHEEHSSADFESQQPEAEAREAQQSLQANQQKLVTSLVQEDDDTLIQQPQQISVISSTPEDTDSH